MARQPVKDTPDYYEIPRRGLSLALQALLSDYASAEDGGGWVAFKVNNSTVRLHYSIHGENKVAIFEVPEVFSIPPIPQETAE